MLDAAAEVSLVCANLNCLHGGVVANGHVWHILCLDVSFADRPKSRYIDMSHVLP